MILCEERKRDLRLSRPPHNAVGRYGTSAATNNTMVYCTIPYFP
jgi:hypothetical protein